MAHDALCFQSQYKTWRLWACPFHEVRDKSQFGRASQPSSCDQAFTVSCIVMQFTHESFGICHFCGSWLNRINPRVLKITNAVCTWRGWTLPPFTLWMWKNTTCLWDHFAQYDFKKSPPFWKSAMKLWIIQCFPLLSHAPSQNFVWHLLWLLITEGKLFNSLFHSAYLVFLINLISIADLFTLHYLWDVCNEDKCCVVTRYAADILVASLALFTLTCICIPFATFN